MTLPTNPDPVHTPGVEWYYISFADADGFLGGCYVEAVHEHNAVMVSVLRGINPGGDAKIIGALPRELVEEHVLPEDRYRLLMREELKDGFGE